MTFLVILVFLRMLFIVLVLGWELLKGPPILLFNLRKNRMEVGRPGKKAKHVG